MHEAAELPGFVYMLWPAAILALLLSGGLVVRGTVKREISPLEAALIPFAIPAAVLSFIALIVSGIGSLLLVVTQIAATMIPIPEGHAVVKWHTIPAVITALGLALLVLLACSVLAGQSDSSQQHAGHGH